MLVPQCLAWLLAHCGNAVITVQRMHPHNFSKWTYWWSSVNLRPKSFLHYRSSFPRPFLFCSVNPVSLSLEFSPALCPPGYAPGSFAAPTFLPILPLMPPSSSPCSLTWSLSKTQCWIFPRSGSVISSKSVSACTYSVPTSVPISPSSAVCPFLDNSVWMVYCPLQLSTSKSKLFILSPPQAITPLQPNALFPGHKTLIWSWSPCQGLLVCFCCFFFFSLEKLFRPYIILRL